MTEVITNAVVPYIAPIPRNFSVGNGVRIFGIAGNQAQKFHIRLQCSNDLSDPNEVAIDVSVNVRDSSATINSMRLGAMDDSREIPNVPIRPSQKFELLIKCDLSQYKVFINARYYCALPQRIPFDFITHIAIFGDVLIEKICYEEESLAIETPPPSYDEAQARAYASQNYEGDSLLQPTPGRPPYPSDTNPLFHPVLDRNGDTRNETYYNPYQTQTVTDIPPTTLNAASPNFRPVGKSKYKTIRAAAIFIFILILIIVASVIFPKTKHK